MDKMPALTAKSQKTKRIRKLKEKWTQEKTEKLIMEVQIREGLWNILCKEYKDRILRDAMWEDVATTMKMPRAEVTTKWNSIRCSYRASLNKMMITKSGRRAGKASEPNSLFKSLKFLKPTLGIEPPKVSNIHAVSIVDNFVPSPPSPLNKAENDTSSLTAMPSSSANFRKRKHESADDNYYGNVFEQALKTLNEGPKSDYWDDVGNFVAANGREWAKSNEKLANEFKALLYKLIAEFAQKAMEEDAVSGMIQTFKEDTLME